MNYFQPDFWLGMTASPERTDGFDIFNLFDHNIAYEVRVLMTRGVNGQLSINKMLLFSYLIKKGRFRLGKIYTAKLS